MIVVGDIFDQVARAYGNSDESRVYEKLNLAVELLQNEGHWNPNLGFMDICTHEKIIALPPEVEIPLAVNIGGYPANFRNKWFEFHLNGPGSQCCKSICNFSWEDLCELPTFRRITKQGTLCFTSSDPLDVGAVVWVYGKDDAGLPLIHTASDGSTQQGAAWTVGATCVFGGQLVKQIDRVSKPITKGFLSLQYLEDMHTHDVTIGLYQPWETEPSYRRIYVNGVGGVSGCGGTGCGCSSFNACESNKSWVRMRFRRKTFKVSRPTDVIFLNSSMAILMAVKAVKKYDADLKSDADEYMAQAVTFLDKKQAVDNGPNTITIQVQNHGFAGGPGQNMI